MVKNGTVVDFPTGEEILEHLKGLLSSYKEHGYKKGNLAGIEMISMGKWGIAVTVHWIIDHVNGSILRDFFTTYNLFLQDGKWKILVTTNHDDWFFTPNHLSMVEKAGCSEGEKHLKMASALVSHASEFVLRFLLSCHTTSCMGMA